MQGWGLTVLYARRGLLKVYLHLLTPVLPDELPPHKKGVNGPISFRPFIKEVRIIFVSCSPTH